MDKGTQTAPSKAAEVEAIQSAHRQRLIQSWHIEPGARVLEIGCGQGDMTAVLAKRVGPNGHVVAVDLAEPDYGAPLTLGESTSILKASPIGNRIEFRFSFDVLDPSSSFEEEAFDYAVLAHSSWYFRSVEELGKTLRRIRPWAKKLCFAEWDLEPHSFDQLGHFLAVLIQGQVEAFKSESQANVRTPISRTRLKDLILESGWSQIEESSVHSPDLQDGDWEIAACLGSSLREVQELVLPAKYVSLVETQLELLKQVAMPRGNAPLSCYSILAERR